MSEADEIAEHMLRRYSHCAFRSFFEAREWVRNVWPEARDFVGAQMLDNVAESVLRLSQAKAA